MPPFKKNCKLRANFIINYSIVLFPERRKMLSIQYMSGPWLDNYLKLMKCVCGRGGEGECEREFEGIRKNFRKIGLLLWIEMH